MGWIIVLVIIAVVVFWAVGAYNRLVSLRNKFKNAFAQIDVQLKRRYDLIPNLVETAKGYMKHERETLERVIAARNTAVTANAAAAADPGSAGAMQGLITAEGALSGALSRLFALVEAYPDRAPGLQRLGDELQHRLAAVPDQRDRRHVLLRPGRTAGRHRERRRAQGRPRAVLSCAPAAAAPCHRGGCGGRGRCRSSGDGPGLPPA